MTAHRGPTAAARSLAVFPAGSNGEYDLPPLNPMSTKLSLSLAHAEADIGRLLDAARAALRSA